MIRTLDPPLHEVPSLTARRLDGGSGSHAARDGQAEERDVGEVSHPGRRAQEATARASEVAWKNSTSSTRCWDIVGCRLGITYPEITEMQARRDHLRLRCWSRRRGIKVLPEVMIPAGWRRPRVGDTRRPSLLRVANEVLKRSGLEETALYGRDDDRDPRAALDRG